MRPAALLLIPLAACGETEVAVVQEPGAPPASLAERRAREAEDAARQAREKSLELRSRYFLRALATVVALGSAGMARRVQTVAEEEAPWQK